MLVFNCRNLLVLLYRLHIAHGYQDERNFNEKWGAPWGATTDGSGNKIIDEYIYTNGGPNIHFGYYTRFDIYDSKYILFFSDQQYTSRTGSTIYFIEDKKDTQANEFMFDSTANEGINIDPDVNFLEGKTVNDLSEESLFGDSWQ